jgi:alkylation response protein AidB-like acyl-CoA dehydrogenase
MVLKVVSGRAAIDNAAHCIQVHGGMGYTDEHNAHLYLKRAHVLDHLFGSGRESHAACLDAARAGSRVTKKCRNCRKR